MEFLNNLGDMRILDILRTQHSINAKLASSTPRTMAQNKGAGDRFRKGRFARDKTAHFSLIIAKLASGVVAEVVSEPV